MFVIVWDAFVVYPIRSLSCEDRALLQIMDEDRAQLQITVRSEFYVVFWKIRSSWVERLSFVVPSKFFARAEVRSVFIHVRFIRGQNLWSITITLNRILTKTGEMRNEKFKMTVADYFFWIDKKIKKTCCFLSHSQVIDWPSHRRRALVTLEWDLLRKTIRGERASQQKKTIFTSDKRKLW